MAVESFFNPGVRLCGAHSRSTSIVYLLLCGQWAFVAWAQLGQPLPMHRASTVSLLGSVLAIVVLVGFSTGAASRRDRLVIWLGVLGFLLVLLTGAGASLLRPIIPAARAVDFAASVAAGLVSVSLLYSAFRYSGTQEPQDVP